MDRLYRLSQEERGAIREQIAAELSREPDVLFAYVYGSFCKSEVFHDIDIGIYLSADQISSDIAVNLSANLSGTVKLPIDVRILNAAPVSFLFHVLLGDCLFSRDDDLRTDIMEDTMRRYFDIAPLLRHATKEAFGA